MERQHQEEESLLSREHLEITSDQLAVFVSPKWLELHAETMFEGLSFEKLKERE